VIEGLTAEFLAALQGPPFLRRSVLVNLGMAHFPVGEYPASLGEGQGPLEFGRGQEFEGGVRLGLALATLPTLHASRLRRLIPRPLDLLPRKALPLLDKPQREDRAPRVEGARGEHLRLGRQRGHDAPVVDLLQ
jgi:hypothetical protein